MPSYKTGLFLAAARVNKPVYVPSVFQEALKYFNETTKQKEMLEFALNYLQTEDEVCCQTVSYKANVEAEALVLGTRVNNRETSSVSLPKHQLTSPITLFWSHQTKSGCTCQTVAITLLLQYVNHNNFTAPIQFHQPPWC